MPEMFVTHRGVVYPWQCDHVGHMNVMWYVGKFDEATWQMFASMGLTPSYLKNANLGIAATRQNIAYRRELRAGDLITIRSGILEIHPRQIRFYHEMCNDETGEVAAAMTISGLMLNTQTRRPHEFPAEIVERGRGMIVEVHLLV